MAGMSGGFGGSSVSQTKRDINLQQGSKDDRWQICETCLGPNPFVRMMKLPMSRECKISTRPYTAFRFRPGKEARWKETIICYEVAVAKNVCQVCLFDMQFQLPTAVIDKYMRDKGEGGAAEQAAHLARQTERKGLPFVDSNAHTECASTRRGKLPRPAPTREATSPTRPASR